MVMAVMFGIGVFVTPVASAYKPGDDFHVLTVDAVMNPDRTLTFSGQWTPLPDVDEEITLSCRFTTTGKIIDGFSGGNTFGVTCDPGTRSFTYTTQYPVQDDTVYEYEAAMKVDGYLVHGERKQFLLKSPELPDPEPVPDPVLKLRAWADGPILSRTGSSLTVPVWIRNPHDEETGPVRICVQSAFLVAGGKCQKSTPIGADSTVSRPVRIRVKRRAPRKGLLHIKVTSKSDVLARSSVQVRLPRFKRGI